MAYAGLTLPNPYAAPGTLNPSGSLAESNPLPPPGRPLDASAVEHPLLTVHIAAVKHVYTILCAETITEGGEWTFTFTPTKTVNGVAVADALRAVTLNVTVGATHTPTGIGDDLVTAFNAAKKITAITGVTSHTRIGDFIGSMSNSDGTVTVTGLIAGETFSVSYTAESGGSATVTNTVDAAGTDLRVGTFIAKTGSLASDGVTPLARKLQSGDTAANVVGIIADGQTRLKAIDPESGYEFQYVRPGRDVSVVPIGQGHGQWTAYAEAAVDYDDDVWVRVVTTGSEIAGAVNDTPDETAAVYTITPTAANDLIYQGFVQVYDRDGKVVATSPFYYLADGSATAAEIVTGLSSDLTSSAVDDYLALSGTNTLILTMTAGYTAAVISTGAGVLATATTTAYANDHVKLTGVKCSRTTTAAGSCALQF